MNLLQLLPVFLVGLLGSVHCVGMCGGIVGAMTAATPQRKQFPVAVVAALPADVSSAGKLILDNLVRVVTYNLGRIASYAMAGAIAGGAAQMLIDVASLQAAGYWIANVFLIAVGLYLCDWWRGLVYLENAGRLIWRRIAPLTGSLLPLDRPWKLLLAGALWGWLPCGMVYSVLISALLSGSSAAGAALMLAFGFGTLPMLLSLGVFGEQIKLLLQRPLTRKIGGAIVIGFGVLGLLRAAGGMTPSWFDALCVAPAWVRS